MSGGCDNRVSGCNLLEGAHLDRLFCERIRALKNNMFNLVCAYFTDEDAQGITEYGAILAFVAILVALVFAITQGALTAAISKSFSAAVSQLNRVSLAGSSAS